MQNPDKNNLAGKPEADKYEAGKEISLEDQVDLKERDRLKFPPGKLESAPPASPPVKPEIQWIFGRIDEIAKNCRKIYFIYLGILSYGLLTVIMTPSQDLFLGQNVLLPLVKVPVTLNWFLSIIPLMAIGIFIYSQLYLLNLDKLISYAIKKCRDTDPKCPEDRRNNCNIYNICETVRNQLYPWMVIFGKYSKEGFSDKLQRFLVKFSLWAYLPFVLILFTMCTVKKHDESLFSYLLIFTSFGTGVVFFVLHYFQHPAEEIKNRPKTWGSIIFLITVLAAVGFLYFLNHKAKEGAVWFTETPWSDDANLLTKVLRYFSLVDLSHKKLTREPVGKQKFDVPYWLYLEATHLEGANLSSSNLTKANLKRSILKRAYMRRAILDGADLEEANLSAAILEEAHLEGAVLYRAKLCNSNLAAAKLQGAVLSMADLRNADLQGADLRGAKLHHADLRNADLSLAILHGAILSNANLLYADLSYAEDISVDQLKEALNWKLASYSSEVIDRLGLPKTHNDNVDEKNFEGYDLEDAYLHSADFNGANLRGTNLKNANLQWADLRGVKELDKENLKKARNYMLAYYSDDWLAKLGLEPDHNTRVKKRNFEKYPLQGANLTAAALQGANIKTAKLQKACLLDSDLSRADLSQAKLIGTDLGDANLKGAKLNGAELMEANLNKADLSGADLQGANLTGANLQDADMREIKNITLDQLLLAKNYKLALYSRELITSLGLPPDHNDRVAKNKFVNYNFKEDNLQGANLKGTNLSGAELQEADLQDAKLIRADLHNAELVNANLQGADLLQAILRSANLTDANLSNAELNEADLKWAILQNADLSQVNFFKANLQYADLRNAKKITVDQLKKALNWCLARYSPDLIEKLGLPNSHNDNVDNKNFEGYKLAGSNLKHADFTGADLRGVDLKNANIQYADFREAKNISQKQLRGARNWKLAFYGEKMLEDLGLPHNHNNSVERRYFRSYDFTNANLQQADFRKANLKDATLTRADLRGANLWGANLQHADLKQADLHGANLNRADLQYADLTQIDHIEEINIKSAMNWNLAFYDPRAIEYLGLPRDHNKNIKNRNFREYMFVNATLKGTDLEHADLLNANLQNADLREAKLNKAVLIGAILKDANLGKAQLREAKLTGAYLVNAYLRESDLKEAILNKASLQKVDLRGADLRSAELLGTNLQGADLRGILYSDYKQFINVETLYQAKMDENLMVQIERGHPSLFKKPVF